MEVRLTLNEDNTEKGRYRLGPGEYVIGRDSACEIVVASDAVSRRHVRLTVKEDSVYAEDLGSANGTLIGDTPANGRVVLESGQQLRLGRVLVKIHWEHPLGSGLPTIQDIEQPASPEQVEAVLQAEKYQLNDVVAHGGMGIVHRARDQRIRRQVAMKLMSPAGHNAPIKRLRFLEEAQVTGQLEHPNIVPVYDLGLDRDGNPYYTMKYVRGISLQVVLNDIRDGKTDTIQQFPLPRLLTIFQKTCDAVAFAHSKGIIHRDLKPSNIMIGDFGEVLVMDWGLAKRLGRAEPMVNLDTGDPAPALSGPVFQTADGVVMGTPHYMPPEQAAGNVAQLDARTDIFMLGGVLYSILTLQPPFPGETAKECMRRIQIGDVAPPQHFNGAEQLRHFPNCTIPDSLAAVAMKALAMHPDFRYQTVRELQRDIDAFLGGFATSAEAASKLKQVALFVKRRKFEVSFAALAVIALLTVGGVSLARIIHSEHMARESLQALRAAAPAYASQAESLIDEHRFDKALDKISTALELTPNRPDFLLLKGNILQSLLRLADAKTAYEAALRLDPNNDLARRNYDLCTRLLLEMKGHEELTPSALNELQLAMLRQERSSEALAMVRRLGKENQALYETWKTLLENEGLLEKAKFTQRLVVDDAGLFYLNLNNAKTDTLAALKEMPLRELHLMQTEVRDLMPLKETPLSVLNLAGTPVSTLEPLRGAPLKAIVLAGCNNLTDLSPLCDCPTLELIILPPSPEDLECLHQLPKLARIAPSQRYGTSREEIARKLVRSALPGRGLQTFVEETPPAAEFWKNYTTQRTAVRQ